MKQIDVKRRVRHFLIFQRKNNISCISEHTLLNLEVYDRAMLTAKQAFTMRICPWSKHFALHI